MPNFAALDYQGPSRTYQPPIGQRSSIPTSNVGPSTNTGYHDLGYLQSLLDNLIIVSSNLYTFCENILGDFALTIDSTNTNLFAAHQIAYPADTTPGSITFDEYKNILLNNNNNATQYVISAYEDAAAGPGGTNAVDISNIALITSNEAKRIKEFIDGYIGDLDDTSEYRTVELFQDWAEDATGTIEKFRQTAAGEISIGLPESELAQTTKEQAIKLQALFRVKLNPFNNVIDDTMSKLFKNWETTSDLFYSKHLGPALQFQLKIGRDLLGSLDSQLTPVLASQANTTVVSLNENFKLALEDQLKRNHLYTQYTQAIMINIAQRDVYIRYIKELSQLGLPLKDVFVEASTIEQDTSVLNATHPLIADTPINDFTTNFDPLHSNLSGLLDVNAHPQYLLRSGGLESVITGDILMEGGVTIDGIIPHLHKHNGTDGSAKISGADIELNSISDAQIDITSTTPVPFNLHIQESVPLISPTGANTVTIQIEFDITDSNVSGYEFEIIELA